jgi:hypothetical protein
MEIEFRQFSIAKAAGENKILDYNYIDVEVWNFKNWLRKFKWENK